MYGIYDTSLGQTIAKFAAPITVKSNVPVFVTDALSLKRTVTKRSTQRWEIMATLEPLSTSAEYLFSLVVQKGHFDEVRIITPQNYGVKQRRTSVSSCTATGTAGNTSVTLSNNSGLIPRGTMIKFANHSKVYMTTADITGNGTMYIFPELRTAMGSAQLVSHRDDVQMSCLFDTDTLTGMSYTDGILMDLGTVKLVEKL